MDKTENVTDNQTNYINSVQDTTRSATLFFDKNTTTSLLNSTEGSNLGHGSSTATSFNIVFIPAFVGLIFVIVFCIQCCKWFRRYSKGDKSDKAYYAVVDPEDDLAIEMSPDSAYDSYCSVSRRPPDKGRNSVRKVLIHDPAAAGPSGTVADRKKSEQNGESIEETITPLIENASKNNNNRKSSSSSSQTTMTTCSESEHGNNSDASKKPARFRVSFVAEVTNENEVHFSKLNKRNLDTGRTSLNSSLRMRNDVAQHAECVHCIERRISVLLKNVGTQTNKSFIYSMKFSKQYRNGGKSGVDSNGIGDSTVYKAKKSESKNNLYDVNTQTTSENNNRLVKICNGGICEPKEDDLSVVQVSCSKTATKNEQQNRQVPLESTSHS